MQICIHSPGPMAVMASKHKTFSILPSNKIWLAPLLLALLGSPHQAGACYMTNGNAVAHVYPSSDTAMNVWTVDGVSELANQAFYYRVGNSGCQTSIYSLSSTITENGIDSVTTENYNDQFDCKIVYSLTGGAPGSGISQLSETVTLTNLKRSVLDFHLFQYVDLDLSGTYGDDTLQLGKTGSLFTSATQKDGSTMGGETLSVGANHALAELNGHLLQDLSSKASLTLNGNTSPVGPGDADFGFEWDLKLAAHGTFTMSINKFIQPVPEPATCQLLGLATAAGAWYYRRRQARL